MDAFLAARAQRQAARAQLDTIAEDLVRLVGKLKSPAGVRTNDPASAVNAQWNPVVIVPEDLIPWEALAEAVHAFSAADSAFQVQLSGLTPQQRQAAGEPYTSTND